jgi:succinyl-CoA synthetase beta subunit
MTIDDNALSASKNFWSWLFIKLLRRQLEQEARKFCLSYIQLSGHIGCLVNGLFGMATMDCIQQAGGEPANFWILAAVLTLIKFKQPADYPFG